MQSHTHSLSLEQSLGDLAYFIRSRCNNKDDYINFSGNILGAYKRYNESVPR